MLPGQFWTIPLNGGKFACGRVIEIEPNSRRGFLAGLVDWIGEHPPTEDDLKHRKTIRQFDVHTKTIHETALDGCITGYRPLELDGIESDYFISQMFHSENCMLQKGYKILRQATKQEAEKYDVLGTSGYLVIKIYAEKLLKHA